MRMKALVLALAASAVLFPCRSNADWLFTPYVGANVGGDTVESQTNFGISAGWMGAGVFGFEFDAGWAPDFFSPGDTDAAALITGSRVSTYMFNAILGAPVGDAEGRSVRPYLSAGLGAIQSRVSSDLGLVDVDRTDLGWNVGAGAMGFLNRAIGLRGDARYLQRARTDGDESTAALIGDPGRFGFWRMTAGVVVRWGR